MSDISSNEKLPSTSTDPPSGASSSPPPPSAPVPKPPKAPKPHFTPHENNRDMLLCSPAFGALWVDDEYCVVGGGGGGKKYELPNVLCLVRVPLAVGDTKQNASQTYCWDVVHSLDFEEAGTIQTFSDSCVFINKNEVYFVVAHIDALSLVKYENNNGKRTLRAICRVALNAAPLDADSKCISIAQLPSNQQNSLIFAGQDNQTVAVFRLATLLEWSKTEQEIKSTEYIPVAKTREEVEKLLFCEFQSGGRLTDMKTKVIPTTLNKNEKNDFIILLALCTREKSLLVGHFDDRHEKTFKPAKKFQAEDFGFTQSIIVEAMGSAKAAKQVPFPVMFTKKSVRVCQFSNSPVRNHYDPNNKAKFLGVSTDLFVALQPLKMNVVAARIRISKSISSIETLTIGGGDDAKNKDHSGVTLVASRCSEPPSTSIMLPNFNYHQDAEQSFVVAGVEGSLVEYVFGYDKHFVRRFVQGFHADAVTSMAFNLTRTMVSNDDGKNKTGVMICVSTDIARRIAFHKYSDAFSKGANRVATFSNTTEKLAKTPLNPPPLFIQEMTEAAAAKARKKLIARWILFCIFGLILALIINFVVGLF